MGWTGTYNATRAQIIKEVTQGWEWDGREDGTVVVRKCLAKCIRGSTLYAVMEDTVLDAETRLPAEKQRERPRWILVVLIRNGADGEVLYKDMDESVGPVEVNCPLGYLDMAGEPEPDSSAAHWYARVREYHDKKAIGRALAQMLKAGDVFMTSLDRAYSFVRRRRGGRWLLGYGADGVLYRVMPDQVRGIVLN